MPQRYVVFISPFIFRAQRHPFATEPSSVTTPTGNPNRSAQLYKEQWGEGRRRINDVARLGGRVAAGAAATVVEDFGLPPCSPLLEGPAARCHPFATEPNAPIIPVTIPIISAILYKEH